MSKTNVTQTIKFLFKIITVEEVYINTMFL